MPAEIIGELQILFVALESSPRQTAAVTMDMNENITMIQLSTHVHRNQKNWGPILVAEANGLAVESAPPRPMLGAASDDTLLARSQRQPLGLVRS